MRKKELQSKYDDVIKWYTSGQNDLKDARKATKEAIEILSWLITASPEWRKSYVRDDGWGNMDHVAVYDFMADVRELHEQNSVRKAYDDAHSRFDGKLTDV